MNRGNDWYRIDNVDQIDSPSLLVFPDRIQNNIQTMIKMVAGNTSRLRPHVKTYKMAEVIKMQMDAGINQFKCATISEAEMLANTSVKDVLLAHQPVGPKVNRLINLIKTYPDTAFSTIVDNQDTADYLSQAATEAGITLNLHLDIDLGFHRTGIPAEEAFALFERCQGLPGLNVIGIHAYDGHIRNSDFAERKKICDHAFDPVRTVKERIVETHEVDLPIIAGGTPTFPCHATREDDVICSPGTCLLWDWGYDQILPDLNFAWAGLVLTRIISKVGNDRICLDLGHKAIASEKPFPRVKLLNLNEGEQIAHSEEHLTIQVEDNSRFRVGDAFYGVPYHICPTCALYQDAQIVRKNVVNEIWSVVARNRSISI